MTYKVQFEGGVINHNNQKVFPVTLAYDAPLHSDVIRLRATATGSDGNLAEHPVRYYIIEQNNQSTDLNAFHIEEKTGLITTSQVRKYSRASKAACPLYSNEGDLSIQLCRFDLSSTLYRQSWKRHVMNTELLPASN